MTVVAATLSALVDRVPRFVPASVVRRRLSDCDRALALALALALADNVIGDQLNLASVEPRQRFAADARPLQLMEGPVARAAEDHLAERFVAAPRRDGVLAEGLE